MRFGVSGVTAVHGIVAEEGSLLAARSLPLTITWLWEAGEWTS